MEVFKTAGIHSAESIPIVYTGTPTKPYLLETDTETWLAAFYFTVSENSPENGQAVLHFLNMQRFEKNPYKKDTVIRIPIQDQKIPVNVEQQQILLNNLKKKFPTIAGAIAAGGMAGGSGAGIGATIGALAFGIPSFGIAAGAGLILGGLIGGGIGVGVGAATGKLVEKVRERKK